MCSHCRAKGDRSSSALGGFELRRNHVLTNGVERNVTDVTEASSGRSCCGHLQ